MPQSAIARPPKRSTLEPIKFLVQDLGERLVVILDAKDALLEKIRDKADEVVAKAKEADPKAGESVKTFPSDDHEVLVMAMARTAPARAEVFAAWSLMSEKAHRVTESVSAASFAQMAYPLPPPRPNPGN